MLSKPFYDSANDPFLLVESIINGPNHDQMSAGKKVIYRLMIECHAYSTREL
jgi:hypothetical protein